MEKKLEEILGELNKLGVHDLREIARSYGIFAPTMLKREELLEKISEKMCGVDPNKGKSPTKRGRPPKTKFISKIRVDIPSKLAFMSDATFSNDCFQSVQDFEAALFLRDDSNSVSKNAIVTGVLQSVNNGETGYIYAINKQTKKFEIVVFVPKIFINEYSLKIGDKIKGSSIDSDTPNIMMLTSVMQVNDAEPKTNIERTFHGFVDGKFPTEEVVVENILVKKGERVLFVSEDKHVQFRKVLYYIEKATEKFDKVIFVATELPNEMFTMIKNVKNVDTFLSEYGDPLSVSANFILASSDYALAMLSEGKNVIIVYYDIMKQAKILETKLGQFDKENVFGFREKTVLQIKRSFSIAKASGNDDGSITSVVCCGENEISNKLIESNFVSVAARVVTI